MADAEGGMGARPPKPALKQASLRKPAVERQTLVPKPATPLLGNVPAGLGNAQTQLAAAATATAYAASRPTTTRSTQSARSSRSVNRDPVYERTMQRNSSRASTARASTANASAKGGGRKKVTAEEGRRMYDAFRYLDKDNSNMLTYSEFEEALVGLGYNPKICKQLFSMVDTNKDGNLEYREFVRALSLNDMPKGMTDALIRAQKKWREIKVQGADDKPDLQTRATAEDESKLMSGEEMLGKGMSQKRVDEVMAARKNKAEAAEDFMLAMAKEKIRLRTVGQGTAKFLSNENLFKAFTFFDYDENGGIDRNEMEEALQMLGVSVSENCLDKLFESFDGDGNGVLDYEEFAHLALGSSGRRTAIYHR